MRISDWSSDVCSSDLRNQDIAAQRFAHRLALDRNGADEKRAAFDLVRAKTRRREEVRSGRQAPSSSPAPPGAAVAQEGRFAAGATSLRLRVNPLNAPRLTASPPHAHIAVVN